MNRGLLFSLATLSFVALASAVGCGSSDSSDGGTSSPAVEPKFSSIKTQIFNKSCGISSSCHSGSNPNGVNLDSSVKVSDLVGQSAKVDGTYKLVVAGDPASSYLYQKVSGDFGACTSAKNCGDKMPVGAPLPSGDIAAIKQWIADGAQDN